jgi:hypothetical protein
MVDTRICQNPQCAIGYDSSTQRKLLSIRVSNSFVDDEAIFMLSDEEYKMGVASMDSLIPLVDSCRRGEQLHRLVFWPFNVPPDTVLK